MKHVQTTISEETRKKLVTKMYETNRHKTVKEVLRIALEEYLKDVNLPTESQPKDKERVKFRFLFQPPTEKVEKST